MSTSAIQGALVQWVQAQMGWGLGKVVMADQDAPRAERPFITVRFGDSEQLGTTDRVSSVVNNANAPLEVLEQTFSGSRRMVVVLRAYTDKSHGDDSAQSVLHRLRTLILNDVTAAMGAFRAAGFSVPFTNRVQNLAAFDDVAFRGVAELGLEVRYSEEVTTKTTYIETAQVTVTLKGEDGSTVSETEVEFSVS